MSRRFNLDEYAPVEERIALFYSDHPEGRILTTVDRLDPPLVVFRAEIYRDASDERPWASGYAYEKEGEGHVNRTSYIENCETSAIGRALANAGYHGKREGAPRPSREEMQKVQRMEQSAPVTEEQLASIEEWIETSGADRGAFMAFLGVRALSDLPAYRYDEAVRALKSKAGAA